MANWKEVLTHFVADVEETMDKLRYRLYYSLGGPDPVKILTYRGYGRPDRFYFRGRVVEDKHIPEAEKNDNLWENLINTYKRMESDEIPFARLVARFQDAEQEVVADDDGYFEVTLDVKQPLPENRLWHSVEVELLEPIPDEQNRYPIKAVAEILVPPPTTRYAVISDIDDTVLRSDATHLIKMARHVFLGNAHTRLPFPGVAALYRALFSGKSGTEMNPLFYVSSSPWNLYDLLSQFFNLQAIPVGPVLFLRNWGVSETEILPLRNKEYKLSVIRRMMDFYPEMPFILIGDSGQEDPEIYAAVVEEFPKRVLAVYIRNVSRDLKRPEAIQELAESVVEDGAALVLADDSVAIAEHAIENGFILPESIELIREDKQKDETPPSPVEVLLGEEKKTEGPTVELTGATTKATQSAVKDGAVEEAVKNAGDEKTEGTPTVVVEGKKTKPRRKKNG